jgi:Ulp1 family protease
VNHTVLRTVVAFLKRLQRLIDETPARWYTRVLPCPQQPNGTECGVHTVVNAACLLSGRSLEYPAAWMLARNTRPVFIQVMRTFAAAAAVLA